MPVIKVKSEEVKIKVPVTVLRIEPTTQTKTVEPSIEKQVITPDEGVFALSSVTVNAVTSEIDKNIASSNIKEGVEILGVTGSMKEYKETVFQSKEVTPTTDLQNIVADDGYDALSSVTVNPVTSEIDENIKAENIKSGVSILGVEGEVKEATSDMVNLNDYFETTITDENRQYFFTGNIFKKFPESFEVETTNLSYLYAGFKGKTLPYVDTSNCEDFRYFAENARNVESIWLLDCSNATAVSGILSNCSALKELGGFKDLGKSYKTIQSANYTSYTLTLSSCTKLTEQSLINVLNGLYDIASIGVKTQTCQLGSTNLAKLTSEEGQQALANAQAKGWNVS